MDYLEYASKLESEGRLYDTPVSKDFRMLLMKTYNMAAIEHRVFLAYLLYTDFTDKESSNPVIDTLTVAKLYGVEKQGLQRNFRVLKALEEFVTQTGIQLDVSEYSRLDGEARTAFPLLTRELELLRERDTLENRQEVLFITGVKYSGRWKAREQQKRRERRASVVLDSSRENAHIAKYLNATPSNVYAQFGKNIEKAKEYVMGNLMGKSREHQLRILKELEVYFPPAYKQVDNSERIYTLGYSAVYLKKKVREILFDTCWKVDLSNAHLVIAAHLWGLSDLLALLEQEGSVWPYLLRELELPDSAKPVLKTSLYSAVYGMPVPQVKGAITRELGREVTVRCFKLPLMSQLVMGRESRLQEIREQGFMLDAFGKHHAVKVEKDAKKQAKALRTLLSHEIGSYEVRVMAAAVRGIEESKGAARLVLWLHDGIYVKFRDSKRADLWKSRIREAVEEEARKLNLPLRFVDEQ